MKLLTKSGEWEVPQDWIAELDAVFYNVDIEMGKMRLWLKSKPGACPTKSGIKRFMVNWLKKDPSLIRPITKNYVIPKNEVAAEPLETRLSRLAELKAAIK